MPPRLLTLPFEFEQLGRRVASIHKNEDYPLHHEDTRRHKRLRRVARLGFASPASWQTRVVLGLVSVLSAHRLAKLLLASVQLRLYFAT